MPRTKHSKNTKRNRDTANEEALACRLKQFDIVAAELLQEQICIYQQDIQTISSQFSGLQSKLPPEMLAMTMGDLRSLNAKTVIEFNELIQNSINNSEGNLDSANSLHMSKLTQKKSQNDEGYLTEDSANATNLISFNSSQMPRPERVLASFSSAKAKHRRSKSACGFRTPSVLLASMSIPNSAIDRSSRSIQRTPLHNRIKAFSADRTASVTPKITPNTPLSLLRYPKAGETVISLSGSPVVVQSVPDTIANVNIPIRNGVISLRPTKMQSVDADLISKIDRNTFNQIKQLQSNLHFLLSIAAEKN